VSAFRFRKKIKAGQPCIILYNHRSDYDILALVTPLEIRFRWVIKPD